jgi:hypothetical protein
MAANKKKPTEYGRFEKLTKQLLTVPKPALDKEMRKYESNKARRKSKGSDGSK